MRTTFIAGASSCIVTALFVLVFIFFIGTSRYVPPEVTPEQLSQMSQNTRIEISLQGELVPVIGIDVIKMIYTDDTMKRHFWVTFLVIWFSGFLSAILAALWLRRRANA